MRKNVKLALIFNILIVLMEVVALTTSTMTKTISNFAYCAFANILALISSILMVVYILNKKEINETPFMVVLLRYMASVSLTLTTLVLFILIIPMENGLGSYFNSISLYVGEFGQLLIHVLCPIMSLVSFIFFEGDRRLNKKKTMYYPCLFSLAYLIISFVLTTFGKVESPYLFLNVNAYPWYFVILFVVVIGILNYLIARYALLFNQIKAPRIKLKR